MISLQLKLHFKIIAIMRWTLQVVKRNVLRPVENQNIRGQKEPHGRKQPNDPANAGCSTDPRSPSRTRRTEPRSEQHGNALNYILF